MNSNGSAPHPQVYGASTTNVLSQSNPVQNIPMNPSMLLSDSLIQANPGAPAAAAAGTGSGSGHPGGGYFGGGSFYDPYGTFDPGNMQFTGGQPLSWISSPYGPGGQYGLGPSGDIFGANGDEMGSPFGGGGGGNGGFPSYFHLGSREWVQGPMSNH